MVDKMVIEVDGKLFEMVRSDTQELTLKESCSYCELASIVSYNCTETTLKHFCIKNHCYFKWLS